MSPTDKKYCVMCEAQGYDYIEADHFIKINNDLIPVCSMHQELVKADNLLNILDEESSE